ncbi:MAG: DUF3800 domain-containing protein [Candidatus Aquilonibacter sp.]
MAKKEGTKEELTEAIPARVARQRKHAYQEYLTYLRLARRIRLDLGLSASSVDAALSQGQDEFAELTAEGRVVGRAHAKITSTETCTIYIDECGSHTLSAKEKYKAFALGAVIIRDSDEAVFDALWKQWKAAYLGNDAKLVHEPDVRKLEGTFFCGGDIAKQKTAVIQLEEIISKLPFSAICCVLQREKYVAKWGTDAPNESLPHKNLPNHAYAMMLSFLAERIALSLQNHYGGAKGRLVLEARDPLGDALLQYEFARLFLDGTAYISASYFRHQFLPGLRFITKDANNSGMQIADLLARPCADKVIDPTGEPARWKAFKPKLCTGRVTMNSILGLKIIPWDESYECMLPTDPQK